MFDFISELASSFPWVYRGWLWIMSSDYRIKYKQDWAKYSLLYKTLDLSMSICFMIFEVIFVYMLVS